MDVNNPIGDKVNLVHGGKGSSALIFKSVCGNLDIGSYKIRSVKTGSS